MIICENGIFRKATSAEIRAREAEPAVSYKERVVARIRERYSLDDELAILRQRDTKPEEFLEYDAFVEKIKEEERE